MRLKFKKSRFTKGPRDGELRPWDDNSSPTKKFKEDFIKFCMRNHCSACAFCNLPLGDEDFRRGVTLDHFVPQGSSFGFPAKWRFEINNLILSCPSCNERLKHSFNPLEGKEIKSAKFSKYARHFSICHPYFDNIREHIQGGYTGSDISEIPVGRTDKGVRTIELFCLNNANLHKQLADHYKKQQEREDVKNYKSTNTYSNLSQEDKRRINEIMDELSNSGAVGR